MLKNFLDSFNFNIILKAQHLFINQVFLIPLLQTILENYDGIMNIILPTLRKRTSKNL